MQPAPQKRERTASKNRGVGCFAAKILCNSLIQRCLAVGYLAHFVRFCTTLSAILWLFAVKRSHLKCRQTTSRQFYAFQG